MTDGWWRAALGILGGIVLLWAVLMGFLVFGDLPTSSTLMGGLVIFLATTWIARREAGASRRASPSPRYQRV
mgnify:CR=1 FL=1